MTETASRPLRGIVTGAASGIGEAIAHRLVAAGHGVFALDLDADRLEELASSSISVKACDVTDAEAVRAAVAEAAEALGGIDFLVNSAGIMGKFIPIRKLDLDDFDRVMAINLRGTALTMAAAIPFMRQAGGGSVVNIGSVASMKANAMVGAYTASKHAVAGLGNSVAVEEAAAGIRVNTICPGFIHTPMYDRTVEQASAISDPTARIPMGRVGKPEDIAHLAEWLIGPLSTYVTGQLIAVDGGTSLT